MGDTEGTLKESRVELLNLQHAVRLDAEDPLKHLRAEFIIPSRADLKRKTLVDPSKALSANKTFKVLGAYWQHQIARKVTSPAPFLAMTATPVPTSVVTP